jgi:membrane-associated phospholipid phosphatase
MAGYFTGIGIRYTGSGMLIPLIFILLAAGLTTTSRLYLNRHTPNESWVGAIVGYTFCLTLFFIFV